MSKLIKKFLNNGKFTLPGYDPAEAERRLRQMERAYYTLLPATVAETVRDVRERTDNLKRNVALKRAVKKGKLNYRKRTGDVSGIAMDRKHPQIAFNRNNPEDVEVTYNMIPTRLEILEARDTRINPNIDSEHFRKLQQENYRTKELEEKSGEVLSGLMEAIPFPSKIIGGIALSAKDPNTSFLESMMFGNKGIGELDETAGTGTNLLFDLVAPAAWSKGLKLFNNPLVRDAAKYMTTVRFPLTLLEYMRLGPIEFKMNPNRLSSGIFPEDVKLVAFPSRRPDFSPILMSDLPEYLKMVQNGEFKIVPYGGEQYKMYYLGNKQPIRHDVLVRLLDEHLLKRELTPSEIALSKLAPTLIQQMNKNFNELGDRFMPENWFSNRPWLGSKDPGAVTLLDIDIWNSHIPEYSELAKKLITEGKLIHQSDGTWLGQFGNSNPIPVLPEEYIVANSDSFVKNGWRYDGINRRRAMSFDEYKDWLENGGLGRTKWTTDSREQVGLFSSEGFRRNGKTVLTIVGNNDKIIERPTDYAKEARRVEHGVEYSPNVDYKGVKGNYTVYGEDAPVKSLRGNNGDFSNLRQGIFKAFIPTILGGTFLGLSNL